MPRGVPKAGFRMTKNRRLGLVSSPLKTLIPAAPVKVETEEEIYEKLKTRFDAMETMARATAMGKNRSLIISGPAGLGKSFGVMQVLDELEKKGLNPIHIRGFVRPTGLYKILYENRFSKSVIVFDDSDSLFGDDICLNLLKTACDMTEKRVLHWLAETRMEDTEGEKLPRDFEFKGSIIFITNYDMAGMAEAGSKMAPHFEAMISRSHYLDLAMKTRLDYMVRIRQVVKDKGMLKRDGFTTAEEEMVLGYITQNQEKLRELSLRMVLKVANLVRLDSKNWMKLANVTCCK
jgi:hypothetical protein